MHEWRNRTFDILIRYMKLSGRFDSIVDLGCGNQYFKQSLNPKKYVSVGITEYDEAGLTETATESKSADNPDIDFNLDTDKKYPFKSKEFDLVIASQILEHLHHLENAVKEIKRISNGHILIGLPNDMRIDVRLRMLFGVNPINVSRYGHCWMFDAYNSDSFISRNFIKDGYEVESKVSIYTGTGELHIPQKVRVLLPRMRKNLFAGQIYYLLKSRV